MTVWLEDGAALGPYTLPTAMILYRGDWTTSAAYNEMDLVADPDTGIYLVLQDHTSDAVAFDASAQDAEANPLYRFLFPIGAGAGASALADLSDVAEWLAPFNGDILRYDSGLGLWDAQSLTVHINDLDGVYNPEGATTGQVLAFNTTGTGWWEPTDLPTGGGGTSVSDDGTPVLAAPTDINFAGAGVAVTDDGDGTVTVTIGGGGGGGASALGDLSDVTITTPAAGQVLRYDGAGFANADVDWSDLANVPATFTPEAHAHTTADISDFAEALDDRVAALLVAGTNITLTYDDAAGALTIDAGSGAGGGAATFLDLTDTPAAFGTAGQIAAVNATTDGLAFVDPPAAGIADAPADGNLYGRSDGAWTTIDLPAPPGAYRFWRLRLISETQNGNAEARLTEIEFREAAGVAQPASGGTAFGDYGTVANLFDGSTSTYATTAAPYTDKVAGYDFGSPIGVEEVAVKSASNLSSYAPTRFVIEASNDTIAWVEVARADPIDPAWSGFGIVERTLTVTIPEEPLSWSALTGVPATIEALPAAVGVEGQILKVQADGSLAWGEDQSGGGGGAVGAVLFKGARRSFAFSPAATSSWERITLGAADIDTAGLSNASSGFTIPVGVDKVRVRAFARSQTQPASTQFMLYLNDASIAATAGGFQGEIDLDSYSNGGDGWVSGTLPVAAGDTIDMRIFVSSAAPTFDGWIEVEVVEGSLLGGGAAAFRGFRAVKNATQAVAAGGFPEITFQVEHFDTEDAFAANRFTVPAALDGKYMQFTAGSRLSGTPSSGAHALYIRRSDDGGSTWNGVVQSNVPASDAGNITTGPVLVSTGQVFSAWIFLNAAQTLVDDERVFFAGNVLG